jgi:hypothetical protein
LHTCVRGFFVKKLVFCLLAAACLAGPAAAASLPYSATLAQPLDAAKEVMVGTTIFKCSGTSCVTVSSPHGVDTVFACHTLMRTVGKLTSYGSAATPFSADDLARCNVAD